MVARWLGMTVVVLSFPWTTYGQAFVVSDAYYSYLHSPWFQVESCSYKSGCEFKLSGVIGVTIDPQDSTLEFSTADLSLSGNEQLSGNPNLEYAPVTGPLLGDWLQNRELVLAAEEGDIQTFRWTRGTFQLKMTPTSLRLDGGYDLRPVDGDGMVFSAIGTRTWLGDANLDLHFDSNDLIQILAAGQYEDNILHNSDWTTGDWNGDGEFDTSDLVAAFGDGGYEQGPRNATSAVPEPTSWLMLAVGLAGAARWRRSR